MPTFPLKQWNNSISPTLDANLIAQIYFMRKLLSKFYANF